MKQLVVILSFLFYHGLGAQNTSVPAYYKVDEELSGKLSELTDSLELNQDFDVGEDGVEQISLAVIYTQKDQAYLGGVNYANFIYPASVYKMYVAAEVLHQISKSKYDLSTSYVVEAPNVVDTAKEILSDPRPLLKDHDTVTVNYLLDLMITRSDNTAANCLIDLADRKNINSLIGEYQWQGSEVTRKFLGRNFEDPKYKDAPGTMTSALHASDFLFLIDHNRLVNPWVSMQLKMLLGRQLDISKYSQGLPRKTVFYHKTGWFSYWTNDVGIVDNGDKHYIIACFLPLKEEKALPKFKALSERIDALMNHSQYKD